jgi:hypothetical protein
LVLLAVELERWLMFEQLEIGITVDRDGMEEGEYLGMTIRILIRIYTLVMEGDY